MHKKSNNDCTSAADKTPTPEDKVKLDSVSAEHHMDHLEDVIPQRIKVRSGLEIPSDKSYLSKANDSPSECANEPG